MLQPGQYEQLGPVACGLVDVDRAIAAERTAIAGAAVVPEEAFKRLRRLRADRTWLLTGARHLFRRTQPQGDGRPTAAAVGR